MTIGGIILIFVGVFVFMFYASYSIGSGVYLKAICRIKTNDKVAFLTFDDGPDSVQTPKVLDILKKQRIPATFFCIGHKLMANGHIIRRICSEGHQIGNHSFSHTGVFPLYPAKKIQDDLVRCQHTLEELGVEGTTIFRPPFGVTNPPIAKAVKKLGYTTIGWNIRTMDTQQLSHEKILRRIKKRLQPGSIILLHDRMPQSDVLLEKVLNLLKTEGYQVRALQEYT
ncbi:polysaccharide deacetylase family protein [Bacteroides sp. OttesenSCG-928-D19]|nr:polysaccharide deacetylase family protein [Bacteroides sp. OttesenSCG-928-D19]